VPAQILVALLDERQEYHRMQAEEARAAAARAGLSLEIAFAESNAVLQIHQIFERVHLPEGERPLAIVAHTVTGEGLARVARNAIAAGIGWLILNRRVEYLDGLRRQRPDLPIGCVTPDQEEIGRIHARQVRALGAGGGLLLYLQGPPDTSAAQDRLRATQEGLAGAPFQWKVLSGDWSEASGETALAGWLRLASSERPAVVVAQNDAMATGARRAALAYDRSWTGVPFLGCDGLPQGGQRLVGRGELTATVVLPASAGTAVELVAGWQREHRQPPPQVVLRPCSFPAEERLARPAGG
jgi:ribose transport system substrate-binding protein